MGNRGKEPVFFSCEYSKFKGQVQVDIAVGSSTLGRIPQNSNKKCQLCSLTMAQGVFLCIWSHKDLTGCETALLWTEVLLVWYMQRCVQVLTSGAAAVSLKAWGQGLGWHQNPARGPACAAAEHLPITCGSRSPDPAMAGYTVQFHCSPVVRFQSGETAAKHCAPDPS